MVDFKGTAKGIYESPFQKLIKGPITIFLKFALMGIILLFIIWIFYLGFTGNLTNIGVILGVQVENVGVVRTTASGLAEIIQCALHPDVCISKSTIGTQTTQEQETFYFETSEFIAIPKTVELGKPIIARAQIKITAPIDKDLEVDFENSCLLSNYTGPITITGPWKLGSEKIISIPKGKSNQFSVSCKFVNGLNEKGTKSISISPKLVYSQNLNWLAEAKRQMDINDEFKNPTQAEKLGPEALSMGSYDQQPFYEGDSHLLYVKLSENVFWNGYATRIDDIEIEAPREANLLAEEPDCHFQEQGQGIYTVRTDILDYYNNIDCYSKETLKILGKIVKIPSPEECIRKYKQEFEFTCPFVFQGLLSDNPEQYLFKAQAKYLYEINSFASVTVIEPLILTPPQPTLQ